MRLSGPRRKQWRQKKRRGRTFSAAGWESGEEARAWRRGEELEARDPAAMMVAEFTSKIEVLAIRRRPPGSRLSKRPVLKAFWIR